MILVKYTKLDKASYLSHLDLLRCFNRIIRRASLPVKYSQGFNPHKLLFFSPPLPLGVKSLSEYCQIDSDCDEQEFMERFNKFSIEGVKITEASRIDKKMSFWQSNTFSLYEIQLELKDLAEREKIKTAIEQINSASSLIIDEKEFISAFRGLKLLDNPTVCFSVELNCSDKNLRADKFCAFLVEKAGVLPDFIDITRKSIIN